MARGKVVETEGIEDTLNRLRDQVGGTPTPPSLVTPPREDTPPPIGETYHRSLDDAATLLLNILSPSIRDFLFEMADVTLKIPRWQLVLGGVMCQYESGNSAAPVIDPSWRDIEVAMGKSVCLICGVEFIPKRFGQKFCSQKCGDESRKQEMEQRHKVRDEEEAAKKKFIKENPEQAAMLGLV